MCGYMNNNYGIIYTCRMMHVIMCLHACLLHSYSQCVPQESCTADEPLHFAEENTYKFTHDKPRFTQAGCFSPLLQASFHPRCPPADEG